MAWSTQTWVNFRATTAYVTDGAGQVCNPQNPSYALAIPDYNTASYTNSPLSVNSNSLNCGWNCGSTKYDGARDRSTGVDVRIAGAHHSFIGTSPRQLQVQMGTTSGQYKIWLGLADIGAGNFETCTVTVADANGSLFTVALSSSQSTAGVYGADGTYYTSPANWAAAAGGGGNAVTINSTDTSNGNGGPLITISGTADFPIATIGMQNTGGSSGPPASQMLMGDLGLFTLAGIIGRRNKLAGM